MEIKPFRPKAWLEEHERMRKVATVLMTCQDCGNQQYVFDEGCGRCGAINWKLVLP